MLDAKVRVVRGLEIKAKPLYVNRAFDGIPVQANLVLHPGGKYRQRLRP